MRTSLATVLFTIFILAALPTKQMARVSQWEHGDLGRSDQIRSSMLSEPVSSIRAIMVSRVDPDADLIGYVQSGHVVDGCGCIYFLTTNPSNAIFSDDFDDHVWMNIDGVDVQLTLVSEIATPPGRARRGQRTTTKYSGPGLTVVIESVQGKRYADNNDRNGTITATKGRRTQRVRFKGSCGC